MRAVKFLPVFAICCLLFACASEPRKPSLADIDIPDKKVIQSKVLIKPKSEEEIMKAYTDYLNSASVDDSSRVNALNRLAELEYTYSNRLLKDRDIEAELSDQIEDKLYLARLDKTIQLLSTSLKDYPAAKNNDVIMYQLAKAYDQKGDHQESIDTLNMLVDKHPKSPYYMEAQFRIAEDAFSVQDYSTAEYAYTEVIVAPQNDIFYEKSLFKRGWSRFKQDLYKDAIDDYLDAIVWHKFGEFEKLGKSEREQFNEYFRAVGLAFSYMGGAQSINEYFNRQRNFTYIYYTYSTLSDIYFKQQRFTDAVVVHNQFIKNYPQSENIPYSYLRIIEIWKNSGFKNKIYSAIENFYVKYNPSSQYWIDQNENSRVNRVIRRSLKKYIVLMSSFFHNKFQQSRSEKDFKATKSWYQRYLKHYSAYAQNDNIYFLFAELLAQKKDLQNAFKYYQLAAFENDLIVHKEAAYASILTSDTLHKKFPQQKIYLRKHIDYALKYSQEFPHEKRSQKLIIHAAELAFQAGEYKNTIELADIKFSSQPLDSDIYLANLKIESYFNLDEFEEAESLFGVLLKSSKTSSKKKSEIANKLALSIYRQGEKAIEKDQLPQAIKHYSRISTQVPKTDIAATGLYDAIALNIQQQHWQDSISEILRFQQLYPRHKLQTDVSKKLSLAYLKSNQGIKAAREFEKISRTEKDSAIKSAALWQAAELYQQKNKLQEATRSYQEYVKTYQKPYTQRLEGMHRLSELSLQTGSKKQSSQWQSRITKLDKKALNNVKTERSKYIVTLAYLGLARVQQQRFNRLRLSLPLKKSLKIKSQAMQSAVRLYSKASQYKDYDATTEATYSIATLYKDFSRALLESDRPKNLSDEELDQYEILLEDRAFPFEDKSIEFYEINLARIQQGHFNDWIAKSKEKLIEIFPTRYNRQPKLDVAYRELN